MSSRRAQQRAAATGSVYDDSSLGSKSGSKSSAGAPKTHSGMNRGSGSGGSGARATTLSSTPEESTKPFSSSQAISAPAQDSSRVVTSSTSTSTVVASRLTTEESRKVETKTPPVTNVITIPPSIVPPVAPAPDYAPLLSELAEQLRNTTELVKSQRTTQELFEQNRAAAEAERLAKERAVLEREKEEAKERLRVSQDELERNRAFAEAERQKLLVLAETERTLLLERAKREAEEIENNRAALVEKTAREAAEHLALQSEAAAALLASKENERAMLENEAVEVFGLQAQIANETAAQLQVAHEANAQLNAALAMLHDNYMRVSSQLAATEEEVRTLKSSLRDSNAIASAATAEAGEYRERLVALLEESKARDEQFESMSLQHRAEIEAYNREIESLQSEHARAIASIASQTQASVISPTITAPIDNKTKKMKTKSKKNITTASRPVPVPIVSLPLAPSQPKRGLFSDEDDEEDTEGAWNPSSQTQVVTSIVPTVTNELTNDAEVHEEEEDGEEEEEGGGGDEESLSTMRRQMAALRSSYRELESHAEEATLQLQQRTKAFASEKALWEKSSTSGVSASSRLSLSQLATEAKDNVEQALSTYGETNITIPLEISAFLPDNTTTDLSSIIRSSSAFIQTLLLRSSRRYIASEEKLSLTDRELQQTTEERDSLRLMSKSLKEENAQNEAQLTLLADELDKACIRAQTAEKSLADTQVKFEQSNAAHSLALVQLGSAQGLHSSGSERIAELSASLTACQLALESLTQQTHAKDLENEAERGKAASDAEAMRRDLLESRSAIERAQFDLQSSTERFQNEMAEIVERERTLQSQISEHLTTISSLRSSRETDASTIAQGQALSASLQLRLDEVSMNLQSRIDDLQMRLNESREETAKSRSDQNAMKEELRSEINQITAKSVAEQNTMREEFMTELNNTKHALDIAVRDGDSVQAALAAARKDLSEAVDSKNEVAAARDSALTVLTSVETARGVLEASIAELRTNLKTKEDELAHSRAEYDALLRDSQNVVSLRASIDAAKSEVEKAHEKENALIKAREEVEAALQRARGEIGALTASVESSRVALADANKVAGAAAHAHEIALAAANAATKEATANTGKALASLETAKTHIASQDAKISELQSIHGDIASARKILASTTESSEKAMSAAKSEADKMLAAAKEEASKLTAVAEARLIAATTAEEDARKSGLAAVASKTAEADVKAIELVSAAQEALMDARHRAVEIEEETKALIVKMKNEADMALSAKADIAEHMIKMAEDEVEKLRKAATTVNSDVLRDIDVKREEAAALIAEAQKQAAELQAEASAKIAEASRVAEEIAVKNAARIEILVSEAENRAQRLDSESAAKLEAMAASATRAAFSAADLTISNAHRQVMNMEESAREALADARQGAIAIILDAKHQADEVIKKAYAEALSLKDILISSIVQSESASADEPGSLYEKAEHFASSLPENRRDQLVPSIMPNRALEEDEQIKQDLDMLQRKAIAAAEATRKKADEDAKATLARVQEEAKALRAEALSAASAANSMRVIAEEEAKSIVARALEETKKMHADASAAVAAVIESVSIDEAHSKKGGLRLFRSSSKATFAKVHPSPVIAANVPSSKGREPPTPPKEISTISETNDQSTAEDSVFLIKAKEEAENILIHARAEAARVQHEADVHASSVLKKAFGEVELMIERAHDRANEIVNNAESKMREKNESLAAMEKDVEREVRVRLDKADSDAARLLASAKANAADILKVARIQADALISGSSTIHEKEKETLLLSTTPIRR
jgi:hypothetical protein